MDHDITTFDTDLFEPEEAALSEDRDDVADRIACIKPPGKGDSGMAEEKG